eukprot:15240572-Ditylum_brightwellii.AAC.1
MGQKENFNAGNNRNDLGVTKKRCDDYEWPILVTRNDGSTILCIVSTIVSNCGGGTKEKEENGELWRGNALQSNDRQSSTSPSSTTQSQYGVELSLSIVRLSIRRDMASIMTCACRVGTPSPDDHYDNITGNAHRDVPFGMRSCYRYLPQKD